MKITLVAAALLACTVITASAGDHKHKRMERLSSALNLTTDQQTKIQAIVKEEHEKVKPTVNSRIRSVLTSEQQTKFDELMKKHEARRQEHQNRKNK